jgi:maltose alpha-D-glucosyltransferase/alpha-amylase
MASTNSRSGDPLWFKDAIFYEIRIKSFADSNADGLGDFPGATARLDYLADLGVTVLWLLPFYPSPGRDDGYDIADYLSVHPDVGTLHDFKTFLREAHKRNLRVMTELVVNHTSDQHPWFQQARRAPKGSPLRDFYVWSDTGKEYSEARIIFKDFETSNWTWDPVAKAYYWHRFFFHQPDLNYDNPRVRQAIFKVLDFWLKLGVDGLRLDAVPYLYEREGSNCENLPETHAYLKELRRYVDTHYTDRVLLAEANQWPEDAVAYFGSGDECHMAFHFPIMPRLFMSVHAEERFPVVDILNQTPEIPPNSQWAIFLRNHDELTLEMVTEEERDYMYRVYANDTQARINLGIRRRLAPLLGNDRKRIELLNALLFSLPGTPVLYYGDEIGMGDNFYLGDRNGVRTPMQWSMDRNAGFSKANPQKLFLPVIVDPQYHYETVNVETQQHNPHSLLWWTKRIIALRKRYAAFGRGTMEMLHPENTRVLAFIRRYQDEIILVVCNLSRFVQHTELDLSAFKDSEPVELFGGNAFPAITDAPYTFMLGPHSFYWFALRPTGAGLVEKPLAPAVNFNVPGSWANVLKSPAREQLEAMLPAFLHDKRWFQSKAKQVRGVKIGDVIALPDANTQLVFVTVQYRGDIDEMYLLPLSFATGEQAEQLRQRMPSAILGELVARDDDENTAGVLFDAVAEPAICTALARFIQRGQQARGASGTVIGETIPATRTAWSQDALQQPSVMGYEQSNTSIRFGERMILKLMRKLAEGVNPELEIGRFFVNRQVNVPPLLGSLEYKPASGERITLGVMQAYIENQGDAWRYTLGWLGRFLEEALVREDAAIWPREWMPKTGLFTAQHEPIPAEIETLFGGYLADARKLGQRTAEMHLALASAEANEAFRPEPFTKLYQRSLYQTMRNMTNRAFTQLRGKRRQASETLLALMDETLALEPRILETFQSITDARFSGMRIRVHGDYHLGQVLYTGGDFTIIDFEGEPGRILSERRIKRSPLRDVAGMLRSFHYAAYAALPGFGVQTIAREEDVPVLEPWAQLWQSWTAIAFVNGYMNAIGSTGILPTETQELESLTRLFLLEKAVYELGYELNNRPAWVRVPIEAIRQLVQGDAG